jgi:hypothetical protein
MAVAKEMRVRMGVQLDDTGHCTAVAPSLHSVVTSQASIAEREMADNLERFKKDLKRLSDDCPILEASMILAAYGRQELKKVVAKQISEEKFNAFVESLPRFIDTYERWYSESLSLLKQVLPDRLDTFRTLYEVPKSRKSVTYDTYVIEDYLIGLQVKRAGEIIVDSKAAFPKLQRQTAILQAAKARFESSLFEIRQLVQADLFDSEIDTARHLLTNKFLRAAGAIAGVVLEKHLLQVCDDHNVKVAKKNPGINDLNQLLRDAGVIDVPQWRHISLLGDIRNICDHNKQKEPTDQQVTDLLDGADKVLKTIA